MSWLVSVCVCLMAVCPQALGQGAYCNFPSFMQTTGNTPWLTDITNQNADGRHAEVRVTNDLLQFKPRPGSSEFAHNMTCFADFGKGKFLVNYYDAFNLQRNKFVCLRFKKIDGIVTMEQSTMSSTTVSGMICDNMKTAKLLLRHLPNPEYTCPLTGGYQARWTQTGNCSFYFENSCRQGDGMIVEFGFKSCIPRQLQMETSQPLQCMGSFEESGYTFMVLQHPEQPLFWLFRHSNRSPFNFIFTDIVLTTSPFPNPSLTHLRISLSQPEFSTICRDLMDDCNFLKTPCTEAQKQVCPDTCGACNATVDTACQFDVSLQGHWVERTALEQTITINSTWLSTPYAQAGCYDISSEVTKTYGLVTQNNNGCKPRFMCMQFETINNAVIEYRLGQPTRWPLLDDDNYEKLCAEDKFRADPVPLLDKYHSKVKKTVVKMKAKVSPTDVRCFNRGGNYTFSSENCIGSIRQSDDCADYGIMVVEKNCDNNDTITEEFLCLTTYGQSFANEFIVARDQSTGDSFCWIFDNDEGNQLWKVPSAYCQQETRVAIERNEMQPLETYMLTEEANTCNENLVTYDPSEKSTKETMTTPSPTSVAALTECYTFLSVVFGIIQLFNICE